jgi:nicotinamide-nucleotide amidase
MMGAVMRDLIARAELVAARLTARAHTIAVAESSAGGLISAALLAVPGASAFFLGGAVVYTRQARLALLNIPEGALAGIRPSTEVYARLLARTVRKRFSATWGFAETGAAGPAGNRYGDPPGHVCLGVAGSAEEHAITLETGNGDRVANMQAFAAAALDLLMQRLD